MVHLAGVLDIGDGLINDPGLLASGEIYALVRCIGLHSNWLPFVLVC